MEAFIVNDVMLMSRCFLFERIPGNIMAALVGRRKQLGDYCWLWRDSRIMGHRWNDGLVGLSVLFERIIGKEGL
jgi:hypothetical protein